MFWSTTRKLTNQVSVEFFSGPLQMIQQHMLMTLHSHYVPALTQLHTYPMDLGTVRKDLIDGKFENHHSFACEVRRVFHNAIAFWMDRQSMPKHTPLSLPRRLRENLRRGMPVVTREAQEIARKARNAEMKRKADEAKRLKRAADKAKREAERQKKRERKEREKLMKGDSGRKKEKPREGRRRKT